MRRWFLLALAPTGLLAAHALILITGGVWNGPAFIMDAGLLFSLVLLLVEVIALIWVGGPLVQKWSATAHERWTLPVGIALGLLPWALINGAPITIGLVGWTIAAIALGALVQVIRSRRASIWAAVIGGALLVIMVPFLVVRDEFGADLVPLWSAPLWALSSLLGIMFPPVQLALVLDASLLTVMTLFGSAVYLASVVTRRPSTVERTYW